MSILDKIDKAKIVENSNVEQLNIMLLAERKKNAELAAQVERLKVFITKSAEKWSGVDALAATFNTLMMAVNSTPTQNLAERDREVAARAVEDFTDILINELSETITVAYSGCGFVDKGDLSDVKVINADCLKRLSIAYANKIKSGEVEI